MFEDRTINIMAYNLETVLAEKFETVITRGVINTRMRDFYDIYALTNTQTFAADTFKMALRKTMEKRGTIEQLSGIMETLQIIAENATMVDLWQRYRKKYTYATGISWGMVISAINTLANKAIVFK